MSTRKPGQCCECVYWDFFTNDRGETAHAPGEGSGYGMCRRHPPTIHPDVIRIDRLDTVRHSEGLWPLTCWWSWCGEWEQKE
jgi:hypothetical protein